MFKLSKLKIPFFAVISTALLLLSACATGQGPGMGPVKNTKIPKELYAFWQTNAPTCRASNDGEASKDGKVSTIGEALQDGYYFPSKVGTKIVKDEESGKEEEKNYCDDGDINLFAGLLCAAGDPRGCEAVKRAQDGSNGKWYRSPRRELTNNVWGKNSFSPDMALGTQLYIASTNDKASLERWIKWLDDSRPCWVSDGGQCLVKSPFVRFCTDDHGAGCTVRPLDAEMLGVTSKHFKVAPPSTAFAHLPQNLGISISAMILIDAKANEPGYSQHLVGVEIYLLRKLDYKGTPWYWWWWPGADRTTDWDLNEAAKILSKSQPKNPFFLYLAEGKATKEVVDLTLSQCPVPATGIPKYQYQWAWEREDSEDAWKNSTLWDCMFMANLIGVSE